MPVPAECVHKSLTDTLSTMTVGGGIAVAFIALAAGAAACVFFYMILKN